MIDFYAFIENFKVFEKCIKFVQYPKYSVFHGILYATHFSVVLYYW